MSQDLHAKTTRRITALSLLTGLIFTPHAVAVPYASGVSYTGNSASFTLNEPADLVTITRDGGDAIVMSGADSGEHTFDMTGFADFTISVTHSAPVGWTESPVSVGNPMLVFERANGVAVNQNPSSPYFGRFYVSQRDDTISATGRQMGDGIYVFNSNATDGFGITDPADTSAARTAGLDFSQSSHSPFRLSVGKDDRLYISDASDTHAGIFYTDADVSTHRPLLAGIDGEVPLIGQNHGSIMSTPLVSGSLDDGDLVLYTIDQDLEASVPDTGRHIWRYDIGAADNFTGSPTLMLDASLSPHLNASNGGFDTNYAPTDTDISRDPRTGNFVIFGENTYPIILNDDLTEVLYEFDLAKYRSAAYSTDGSALALRDQFRTYVLALDEQGLPIHEVMDDNPNFSSPYGISLGPNIPMRVPIAYDLAGNIYTAGNLAASERLGIYSPGGDSVAVTRSDGTFVINGTTYGESLPGDFNGDGYVGLEDLDIILSHWNQQVAHGVLLLGDGNGDGFVGLDDLDSILGHWNTGTIPADNANIPEPGVGLMLLFGPLLLARSRPRRQS